MPLDTDSPDTFTSIWAKAEAKAEAHEKQLEKVAAKVSGDKPPAEPKTAPSDTEPSPPPDDDEDKSEPAKDKAKPKEEPKEEPAEEPSDERAQLDALAKKLGYSIDGNRVAVNERVKFRQEKQEWRTNQSTREAEFQALVTKTREDLDKQYGRGARAVEAWERGDFDGVAKALENDDKANWKSLNSAGATKMRSPEAKRIAELEERERQREQAEQQRADDAKRQAAEQEQQQAVVAYKERLRGQMGESDNRIVKALSKLPQFVDAVYLVQNEHWDRESADSIPKPDEALNLPFGGRPLLDTAKEMWQALSEAFGDPDASNQEAPNGVGSRTAEASARPGKKPKTLSRNGAAEVSATGKRSDQEWLSHWSKRIAEAE